MYELYCIVYGLISSRIAIWLEQVKVNIANMAYHLGCSQEVVYSIVIHYSLSYVFLDINQGEGHFAYIHKLILILQTL